MKLKIKVLVKVPECMPKIFGKGEWIDLSTAEDTSFRAPQAGVQKQVENEKVRDVIFDFKLISLGVAMQLPEGFEAIIAPRSSTFCKYGIVQSNGVGIIDGSYCGNNDIWKFGAIAFNRVKIPKGTRICQFRLAISQKATLWQRIKWMLCNRIELVPVKELDNPDRKGFGSTGN